VKVTVMIVMVTALAGLGGTADQDAEGQFEKAIVSHRQALEVEPRQGAYNSLASTLDTFADKLEEFIGQEKERWQSRRERREMRRSGQKVKRRAGADVSKPKWTEEQIREKEEKVRTLRLQAAEARDKAKELDSSANIFQFCANTLSGASEPVASD
jgi:predicted N-acyltransferase